MDKEQCPTCRQFPKSSIYAPIIQSFTQENNKAFIHKFISKFPGALNDHPDKNSLYEDIRNMNNMLEPYFANAELLLWNILLQNDEKVEMLLNQKKVNPNITPNGLYYDTKLRHMLENENLDPNVITIADHYKQRLKLLLSNEGQEEEEEEEEEWMQEAWDHVKGGALKMKDVVVARKEEVGYMRKREIWEVKPVEECWNRTGKAPVGVRCVDTNKGTEEEPWFGNPSPPTETSPQALPPFLCWYPHTSPPPGLFRFCSNIPPLA
jgi:hypothetical protein